MARMLITGVAVVVVGYGDRGLCRLKRLRGRHSARSRRAIGRRAPSFRSTSRPSRKHQARPQIRRFIFGVFVVIQEPTTAINDRERADRAYARHVGNREICDKVEREVERVIPAPSIAIDFSLIAVARCWSCALRSRSSACRRSAAS